MCLKFVFAFVVIRAGHLAWRASGEPYIQQWTKIGCYNDKSVEHVPSPPAGNWSSSLMDVIGKVKPPIDMDLPHFKQLLFMNTLMRRTLRSSFENLLIAK